jgi:hypothetical protein
MTLDAVLARYHGNQRGVKAKKSTQVLIRQSVMSEKKFQENFPSQQCAWQHREVDSIGAGFVRSCFSMGVPALTEVLRRKTDRSVYWHHDCL